MFAPIVSMNLQAGTVHTRSLLTHTHRHAQTHCAHREGNNKACTQTPTYQHPLFLTAFSSGRRRCQKGVGVIDILPHCSGLLQGTSLCSAADKAHSITAADSKWDQRMELCVTEREKTVSVTSVNSLVNCVVLPLPVLFPVVCLTPPPPLYLDICSHKYP